jgi:beta-mannosidase
VNKENDSLKVYAISDRFEKFACQLELNLLNFKGRIISKGYVENAVNPHVSVVLFRRKIKDIIKENEIDSLFLNVNLLENGKIIDSQNHFFAEPKEMKLPMPKIQISTTNDGNKNKITLISDVFAKSVYITCENSEGKFSDNYFDLIPLAMKEIEFENKGKISIKDLKFKVISLNEIQNK